MKNIAVSVAAACVLALGCTREEPKTAEKWRRTIEPMVTGSPQWQRCTTESSEQVVASVQCGSGPETPPPACEIPTDSHEAAWLLSANRDCTDVVIEAMTRFAVLEPRVKSDLAAAYYVRAQRKDRPEDLLTALEAAEVAVAANPRLPDAWFNQALIESELGFTADAIASLNQFLALKPERQWAAEGRERRDALVRDSSWDVVRDWPKDREKLRRAADAGQRDVVAAIIPRYVAAVQRHVEEDVLAECAETRSQACFARGEVITSELARLTKDPYLVDALDVIRKAPPAAQAALRIGHARYRDARAKERARESMTLHREAAESLKSGGSPLADASAAILAASLVTGDASNAGKALEELARIDAAATRHGYTQVRGSIHFRRAYVHLYGPKSGYLNAVSEYETAASIFTRATNRENAVAAVARKAGILRILGRRETAWRDMFQARRDSRYVEDSSNRHYYLGESAASALALERPRAALRYQNAVIESLNRVEDSEGQLAIAFRERAGIYLHLSDLPHARQDLQYARALASDNPVAQELQRAVVARIDEVAGRLAVKSDARFAVQAFTRAIAYARKGEYNTLYASLLAQRAEAHRRAGDLAAAEKDLLDALQNVHREERDLLERRRPAWNEEIWSPYFARFEGTYHSLIRHLVEQRRVEEAFRYTERARAYEPLQLLLGLKLVSAEFTDLLDKREPLGLARIRTHIPEKTFLIQYVVLEDRTYAWVMSRNGFEFAELTATSSNVDRWRDDVQEDAHALPAADPDLRPASDALLTKPLALIERMSGGRDPNRRLVFIPDRRMHGLPFSLMRHPSTGRLLIEDAIVSTHASATFYVFSRIRDRELAGGRSALLIGNPAFDRDLPLARDMKSLRHAEEEVKAIAALYEKYEKPLVLIGAEATAPTFLAKAGHYSIVQFSGHAQPNQEEPYRSLLWLAPEGEHSGALEALELLEFPLKHTRLVVLSACSTAVVARGASEGVAPLVRPLISAGAPAVIGSLWDVDDAAAAEASKAFHHHYVRGLDAAAALRAAQLELRNHRNPRFRSGYSWGAFQVIGHASSPFAPPQP